MSHENKTKEASSVAENPILESVRMICGPVQGKENNRPGYLEFGNQLRYLITMMRNGATFWEGDFHLGIGHVDPGKNRLYARLSDDEMAMVCAWAKNRYANFKDKALQLRVAVKLARAQKVEPSKRNVLSCLLLDGEPHFNSMSFAEWASDYGYSDDSMSACKTYDICVATGMKLARAFSPAELTTLREVLEND